MEIPANLCVFETAVYATGNWRPGTLRVDDDGLAFVERGASDLEQLAIPDIESVSISSHLFGSDDVVVARRSGGAWSLKVKGGAQVVEALRSAGVAVRS